MRPSEDFKVMPCCICIEDSSSCKNDNNKKCDKPSPFAASTKTVYASRLSFLSVELK